MKNHWLDKKYTGVVRYTNMEMRQEVVKLPARYRIVSAMNDSYFCKPDENGDLTWINRDEIEIAGQEFPLKFRPAFSIPLKQYVFTKG